MKIADVTLLSVNSQETCSSFFSFTLSYARIKLQSKRRTNAGAFRCRYFGIEHGRDREKERQGEKQLAGNYLLQVVISTRKAD